LKLIRVTNRRNFGNVHLNKPASIFISAHGVTRLRLAIWAELLAMFQIFIGTTVYTGWQKNGNFSKNHKKQ
jgi:hypothetical protein